MGGDSSGNELSREEEEGEQIQLKEDGEENTSNEQKAQSHHVVASLSHLQTSLDKIVQSQEIEDNSSFGGRKNSMNKSGGKPRSRFGSNSKINTINDTGILNRGASSSKLGNSSITLR
jgi:hypothetical protein